MDDNPLLGAPSNPLLAQIATNPIGAENFVAPGQQSLTNPTPGFQPGQMWGGRMISQHMADLVGNSTNTALGFAGGGLAGSTVFKLPRATHLWDYASPAPTGAAMGKVIRTDEFTPNLRTVHYRIPEDSRAAVQYEYDPANPGGHATVTDIFRGDQPFGTSGQMLADAFNAQGVQPKSVSLDNIIHQPTLQAVGQGVPLELTTLGRTLSNTAQHMGASAEGFQWVRNSPMDKPSILVRLNYDRPNQGPVPVAWTGKSGYADENAALMGQRVMQVRRMDHFDPYLDSQNPGSTFINPDEQPTRWVPEEQLMPINYDRSGSPY